PAETMGHPLVKRLPQNPPSRDLIVDQWYLVKTHLISREWASWFSEQCALKARFEALTGPRDRSVLVYHYGT
ncbi:hypothetical protein KA005_31380, partial [bacterium]|nr:hypothetical protein [bacterium]